MERKPRRLCRLSSSPFFSFCSSRARASITSPARWITSRPCAVIGSTSIAPVPRATATSICSVNSRFPLDFERKISYTKSVISRRGVVELQTPGIQNPVFARTCGFDPATGTTHEKTEPVFCRFGFYFTAPLLSAFHRMRSSGIASPPPGRTHTPSLFPDSHRFSVLRMNFTLPSSMFSSSPARTRKTVLFSVPETDRSHAR